MIKPTLCFCSAAVADKSMRDRGHAVFNAHVCTIIYIKHVRNLFYESLHSYLNRLGALGSYTLTLIGTNSFQTSLQTKYFEPLNINIGWEMWSSYLRKMIMSRKFGTIYSLRQFALNGLAISTTPTRSRLK